MGSLSNQIEALILAVVDKHPLGCHRPHMPGRVVFDKLVQVLVLGAPFEKISDTTTIRHRRDDSITTDLFPALEQTCLENYDPFLGLEKLRVDECFVKELCGGGEIAGKSPVDRGK